MYQYEAMVKYDRIYKYWVCGFKACFNIEFKSEADTEVLNERRNLCVISKKSKKKSSPIFDAVLLQFFCKRRIPLPTIIFPITSLYLLLLYILVNTQINIRIIKIKNRNINRFQCQFINYWLKQLNTRYQCLIYKIPYLKPERIKNGIYNH